MIAIVVAAAIITQGGKILACRRREDERSHPGRWEFPGGKQEPGESLVGCLARELEEELGIRAEIGLEIDSKRHHYAGGPAVEIHFFHVDRFEGEPVNRIFAEIRWVAPQELSRLDFLEADRPIVESLGRTPLES